MVNVDNVLNNNRVLNNALNRNDVEINVLRDFLNNNNTDIAVTLRNILNNNDVDIDDVVAINVLSDGEVVVFILPQPRAASKGAWPGGGHAPFTTDEGGRVRAGALTALAATLARTLVGPALGPAHERVEA